MKGGRGKNHKASLNSKPTSNAVKDEKTVDKKDDELNDEDPNSGFGNYMHSQQGNLLFKI